MTANRNAALVGEDLEKFGLQSGKDFCSMEQFLTEWFWNYKKKVCLMEVHSTVTSRCTLKCKHCNMFMPYYKEHVGYTAKDILEDLELLFRHVDYIVAYRILGGEPLINNELEDMIKQIGDRYGDRIGNIGIITNGTLLPDEKLIETSKKYNVKFDFSDYTDVVDYKKRFAAPPIAKRVPHFFLCGAAALRSEFISCFLQLPCAVQEAWRCLRRRSSIRRSYSH